MIIVNLKDIIGIGIILFMGIFGMIVGFICEAKKRKKR